MKAITRRTALKTTLVAGGSILLPRFAHAAEFNFKFTSTQPAAHPSTIRFIEAAERVKLKSGGKFEVTVFHSGQLGTDIDTFTQVRIGGVQMMVLSNLITATAAPLTSLCSIPYSLPTYDHIWRAMDGKLGTLLRADLEKAGSVHREDPGRWLSPDHLVHEAHQRRRRPGRLQDAHTTQPAADLNLASARRRPRLDELLRALHRPADGRGRRPGRHTVARQDQPAL
jgi:hypothetical protein